MTHFVNYGPVYGKINNEAGYALGGGDFGIYKLLPVCPHLTRIGA